MRRSFAIGFTAKKFVHHRSLLKKVNPATVSPSFSLYWKRDFSGISDDYREILRNGLRDIKLDDAIVLFNEMVKSRPYPSIIEFSKLLSTIAKMKNYDIVISLGEQMQNLGISHNDYTYNILINSFCRSSQLSLALAILGKTMKLGYEPSIITLTPLLYGYCHGKRIFEAVALVDQMVEMGYRPNTFTFNTLICGLYLNNKDSEALAFIDRMILKGHSAVVPYRYLHLAMKKRVVSSEYPAIGHSFTFEAALQDLHRAMKKQEVYSEYPTIGHSFNFEAALQDLSQPNAEASPPDGVLTVPLLKYQRIALAWMAQKETTGLPCSGGILADDQGLGKTVSTIALILNERSTSAQACGESIKKDFFDLESESGECAPLKLCGRSEQSDHSQLPFNENIVGGDSVGKARGRPAAGTLVVCPTSVMRQWADELHKKVTSKANLSVLVYHGSSRTKDPHELAKYDVVVTTYSIVSMEVPKQPLVDDEDKEKSGVHDGGAAAGDFCSNKKRKHVEFLPGPLAKVSWFRVVLDEAQSIKNYKTQVARACWGLFAKHRWCLSGTPIQNSIDDLYSYFRFLKYDPYSSYVWFCSNIKDPISRNPEIGYQKLQVILKTVMLRRTKGSLLDGKPIISLPPKSIELRKLDFTDEERYFYSKLEAKSRSQFQEYAEAGTVKENYVNILSMLLRLRQACNHRLLVNGEYSFTWGSSVGLAKKQICSEASLAICGICNDAPEDAVVSVCGHVFCKQCIYERLKEGDNNHCPLSNCNVRLTISSLSSKERLDNATPGMQDCVTSDHRKITSDLPYVSSKIKAALEILQSLARPQYLTDTKQISQNIEDSSLPVTPVKNEGSNLDVQIKVAGEKAIVFSQWTKMLDLLQASLVSSRIEFRRLDGTMSVTARDQAVQDFNTLPEVSVMIMSLKAASLGLNMVAACHVLILDLWWNPTTEDQAIDRAHRIGQTRPVTVVRFTIKDTVEDRILALQERKRMMVASAFGEDEKGSRLSQLTAEDLSYLFMADS